MKDSLLRLRGVFNPLCIYPSPTIPLFGSYESDAEACKYAQVVGEDSKILDFLESGDCVKKQASCMLMR